MVKIVELYPGGIMVGISGTSKGIKGPIFYGKKDGANLLILAKGKGTVILKANQEDATPAIVTGTVSDKSPVVIAFESNQCIIVDASAEPGIEWQILEL